MDLAGLVTTVNRTVLLQDTTPPTLFSSSPLFALNTLEQGDTWPPLLALDFFDGDVSLAIGQTTTLLNSESALPPVADEVFPNIRSVTYVAACNLHFLPHFAVLQRACETWEWT